MSKLLRALLAIDLVVLFGGGVALAVHDDGDDEAQVVLESTIDLAQSADATLSQTTARFEMTMTLAGPDFGSGEQVQMASSGVLDTVNNRTEMTMDMSAMFEQLGEDVPDVALEPIRMIMDGTTMYMCGGIFAAGFGAECVYADLSEVDPNMADLFGGTTGPAQGNSQEAFLETMRAAGDVEELGTDEVRGVPTRHVRATFTLADAIAASPNPEQLQEAFDGIGFPAEALHSEMTMEVWLDEQGLVRRYVQQMDFAALSGGEMDGAATVSIEYFDFGAPITIEVPTHAISMAELFASLPSEQQFEQIGEEINTD